MKTDSFVAREGSVSPSKMAHFACIHCNAGKTETDHRWCLVSLFKTKTIQSVKHWEQQSESNGYLRMRETPEFKSAQCIQSVWRMFVARRAYRARNVTVRKRRIRARIPKEFV